MRKFWLVSIVCSLSMGILHAEQQAPPTASAEVLARAVASIQPCKPRTETVALNEEGNPEGTPSVDPSENRRASKLSLPTIFRTGRFELEPVEKGNFGRRPALIVHFSPLPRERQLQVVPGENKNYARAINNMTGSVFVDPATNGIVQVQAWLKESLVFKGLVHLNSLSVTFDQREQRGNWLPDRAEVTLRGWVGMVFWRSFHDRYTTYFSCAEG